MVLSSPPTSLTSLAQGVAMPPCMASLLLSLQSNQGDVGDHQGMGATIAPVGLLCQHILSYRNLITFMA